MPAGLLNRGLVSLLATQFFGAANDNLLKGMLTFFVIGTGPWAGDLGEGGQGIIALGFTLPFILLSGYGGQFSDRHSKRTVSVLVKIAELPIAGLAAIGFFVGSLWLTFGALILLACQSAYFGPAKYGMVPELVPDDELSRANGIINMLTNIAVIVGGYFSGVLADAYWPRPEAGEAATIASPVPWLPGVILLVVAVAGLGCVLFLPRLPVGDRTLKYDLNPIGTYIQALREMARSPLLAVTLAWGFFYLLAGLALLIVPEYETVLNIDREMAARLLGILAIAIAIGSVTAGFISGHHIEPRLVPIGAVGISVFFLGLGLIPPTFTNVAVLIAGAGFFAGFYIIPLQAALQKLSPDDERGRFLGTANGVSFAFLAVASVIYWLIRPLVVEPQRIFIGSAVLMLLGTIVVLRVIGPRRLRDSLRDTESA